MKKKMTITLESTRHKSLSNDVLNTVYDFKRRLASKGIKLSMSQQNSKNTPKNYVSPENWDYWPV